MREASQKLLTKAEASIKATELLLEAKQAEFAASRIYYAMFYIAEALLYEKGLKFKKHSAVHSAFGEQFSKTGILDAKFHKTLVKAFENRLISDYDIDAAIPTEDVRDMTAQAREFLEAASAYLAKHESDKSS
ncbi:MAG: hypothetical protein A3J52_02785 [Omnitrophica bacterium RIFCSPHIGHO2_02_FULL_49_9]|nr:MAG: hypothetical protein A3J52_02785 [Omnitrophica bacterium RIFCSPHIGHO2_02_FULL_49_9]OGW89306.1 MAG: hypothetical protein A3A73_03590 [Omnitrophica bacterium RIFCSPLOWO2_01_FULL_50_24]